MPGKVKRNAAENDQVHLLDISTLEGSVIGAQGEVRVTWARKGDSFFHTSAWEKVQAKNDFTHQFRLKNLKPGTRYGVKVQARPIGSEKVTAEHRATFETAQVSTKWQDVKFTVVTGQAYRNLKDKRGFESFVSMKKFGPHFLISTGDNVYYDSERPRARTPELARYHWHRMYSMPRLVDFFSSSSGYWEKDDHDTLSNDSYPGLNPKFMLPLDWETGIRLFKEQVPMGEKTYRTIRWGKGLQIWLVEGRDYRSSNRAPDGPNKSIWGKEQKEWLKKTLLSSDATFKVLISPTPIIGPDRKSKNDNHANSGFAFEGKEFRHWVKNSKLKNFYIACGDRHWQYHSVDPETGLNEFSCGPASDVHAGGSPGQNRKIQPYHKVQGGFLSVELSQPEQIPTLFFRHHGQDGRVDNEVKFSAQP